MKAYAQWLVLNGIMYCGPVGSFFLACFVLEGVTYPSYLILGIAMFLTAGVLGYKAAEDKLYALESSPDWKPPMRSMIEPRHRMIIACVTIVCIAVIACAWLLRPYRYVHTSGRMVLDKRTGIIRDGTIKLDDDFGLDFETDERW